LATFISVLSSLLVGIVLVIAPWTDLWSTNALVAYDSALRSVLLSAFTRGAVSGLGLVNLVLAANELRGNRQDPGRS
jgi:hypothetical protein